MKHFLEISQLSLSEVEQLLHQARVFKSQVNHPDYSQYVLANLFYEASTRTRVSFTLAATHLKMPVINLDKQNSSEQKGESILDTIQTLAAMGISIVALRHQDNGLPKWVAQECGHLIHIINAGDGQHAHPTQAMLDMMTILEHKPDVSQLKITIVGDLLHSRVANSFQVLCQLLGVGELVLVAPEMWQPKMVHYGRVTNDLSDGVCDADVIIGLRVQRERLIMSEHFELEAYRQRYAITADILKLAKPDVMVMHPGPMNRGVEIDHDVADGPHSYVLKQVQNGVFMRMAILDWLLE